jgi:hypothetical protein
MWYLLWVPSHHMGQLLFWRSLRRDRVPHRIPIKYVKIVNTKKTQAHCNHAKVAKLLPPFVVTKKVDDDTLLQLCTFQVTSSHFLSVNAYNDCGI